MRFILKLFPEITIKSPPVRKRMTKLLVENLRVLVKRVHPKARVKQDWDKLEVALPDDAEPLREQMVDLLGRVTGIANFAAVKASPFRDMVDIYEQLAPHWVDALDGKTFCVRVKRNGRHDFSSTDLERYIGGRLNQESGAVGVKLKNPDVTVRLEVREETLYLVEQVYQGMGGFPMGSQGGVVSLVSGGFDSTVASYLCMKRGLKTHYLFFNLGGREHEFAVKEIAFYLWHRYGNGHRVKFVTVPFEGVVAEILEKIDPSCMGVVLKRMMLRAAEPVMTRARAEAMVTGEAVAQVSSQTVTNLSVIDRAVAALVLRPLAMMDKLNIIDICRDIGAEAFAANVPEYCGVISVRPSASLKLAKVEAEEEKINMSVIDQALAEARVQSIDQVMTDLPQDHLAPESVAVPSANHKIIDIRHPDERALRPLVVSGCEVLPIPFYSLDKALPDLDAATVYLLYCDKGVMSQLHAGHLLDQGVANVAVYRPNA